MTAWEKLLAASSLLAGTAWQLIGSPKTGGAGLVVNDGVAVELSDASLYAEIEPMQIEVELAEPTVTVDLADMAITAEISPEPIEVEITP